MLIGFWYCNLRSMGRYYGMILKKLKKITSIDFSVFVIYTTRIMAVLQKTIQNINWFYKTIASSLLLVLKMISVSIWWNWTFSWNAKSEELSSLENVQFHQMLTDKVCRPTPTGIGPVNWASNTQTPSLHHPARK